ncbi:precorrin-6y C5,15-methyltransferase (decarboxylating) subunit CbiE [Sneathiella aquimaris]|uniref:precorrin-6y C5,15-methyltransferase (decarboxylating) subunit CbiE n=1 Tax=Sneathiella aquimaris TaxID=2599305 RepID=UPI00146BBCB2|nr:precorrin-6y C5,15-methyltransferase (decarboxylating) subunit CbiE [Sneathiella aquimaris]
MPDPWLSIIGIGEDSLEALTDASRKALAQAELVFGSARHLALAGVTDKGREWPLPFSVKEVLDCKGKSVAVLASGDPFWHGVGGTLATSLDPSDWRCYPAPSSFSTVSSRMGWRLETVHCLGLHAAPLEKLYPLLNAGEKFICLMRDGAQVQKLAQWLCETGFTDTELFVFEALLSPSERRRSSLVSGFSMTNINHPVTVAFIANGQKGLPQSSGLPDAVFASDGQMTKRAVRAVTLSSLSPRAGECLWDIGAGSGTIAIEWLIATKTGQAVAVECREDRLSNIQKNADQFGVASQMKIIKEKAPAGLDGLPVPDAVFIGGGLSADMLHQVWSCIPEGCRVVVNAVTLESEALLISWSAEKGGELMRLAVSSTKPLGSKRGWVAANPILQWVVTR